jgi:5-bromo-4-chloroindolyl phosphate hydrolysis protein
VILIDQEKEIPKLSMQDLIILFFNTIAARCWARLGLTKDEYGEMRQDLNEARLGIDVLDSILKTLTAGIDQELYKELEGVVANLKLNYVNQYNKSKEAK